MDERVAAYLKEVGQRIRAERKKHSLLQHELAARLGVHRSYITIIERGDTNLTLETVYKFSKALHIGIEELLMPFPKTK